jgi:hypothetical protein
MEGVVVAVGGSRWGLVRGGEIARGVGASSVARVGAVGVAVGLGRTIEPKRCLFFFSLALFFFIAFLLF